MKSAKALYLIKQGNEMNLNVDKGKFERHFKFAAYNLNWLKNCHWRKMTSR